MLDLTRNPKFCSHRFHYLHHRCLIASSFRTIVHHSTRRAPRPKGTRRLEFQTP
jgi:hypothetical protein